MHDVVLCADGNSLQHPELLGLEGECLSDQKWLRTVSGAEQARLMLQDDRSAQEVWVVGADDMDPINLAAALKRDCSERLVYLAAARGNGSLLSRANAAGIDRVIDSADLVSRYVKHKDRHLKASDKAKEQIDAAFARFSPGETAVLPRVDADGAGSDDRRGAPSDPVSGRMPDGVRAGECGQAADGARMGARGQAAEGTESGAYVLTVVSASGGTGKSTVAILTALIAQSLGLRTLLIDADLQFGDAAQLLAVKNPLRIDRAVRDPLSMESLAADGDRPAVLAAPLGVEDAELLAGELKGMIGRLRGRFDAIIVNTGSFWMEQHIHLLECSSNTLFLVDQRPTCLRAVKRALELCARCGVASNPFLFAVNRCSRAGLMSSLDFSCALNGAKVAELKDGGPEVAELMGAGLAHELLGTRNDFCLSLREFLAEVLPGEQGARTDAPGASSASRLFSAFRKKRRA